MKHELILQIASTQSHIPKAFLFQSWINEALNAHPEPVQVCIRVVDEEESRKLNDEYRGKNKPTNILSFPYKADTINTDEAHLIGDILICAPLVKQEAKEQEKDLEAHWAHLVIHGILHLIGFDHENEEDRKKMELAEIECLKKLNYPNPYGDL